MEWDEPQDREEQPRPSVLVTVSVSVLEDAEWVGLNQAARGFQALYDEDNGLWITPFGRVLWSKVEWPARPEVTVNSEEFPYGGAREKRRDHGSLVVTSWEVDVRIGESQYGNEALADDWLKLPRSAAGR